MRDAREASRAVAQEIADLIRAKAKRQGEEVRAGFRDRLHADARVQ